MNETNKYKPDYSKGFFWAKKDPDTNQMHYYFNINNTLVEVSKEVHAICYNSYRKDLYYNKQNQAHLTTSLDSENSEGVTYHDLLSNSKSKQPSLNLFMDEIENIISKFDEIDKTIFYKCLYGDTSEKIIANKLNISQQAISKRKKKICAKIKEQLLKSKSFLS